MVIGCAAYGCGSQGRERERERERERAVFRLAQSHAVIGTDVPSSPIFVLLALYLLSLPLKGYRSRRVILSRDNPKMNGKNPQKKKNGAVQDE
jgi:hypothetical protein